MATETYKQLESDVDIISNDPVKVSSGLFSGGAGSITAFYTSSLAGNASASYYNVYDKVQSDSTREVQFAVGYAHFGGSGSLGNTTKTTAGNRETAALYRQFANVLLPPLTEKFTFTGYTTASDDFYFVVMNRARQREKMDPGNWELHLKGAWTKLIDDSGATTTPTVNQAGRVFNIVSGSIAGGTADIKTTAAAGGSFGNFYPDLGIAIIDANKIAVSSQNDITLNRDTNAFTSQSKQFFESISAGSYFAARREEEVTSTMYFCRANNQQFNFSNNPTFATASTGAFTQATFEKDPKVFITQVGLYNDQSELLAVAKLSKPVLKSYSREAIIKVKLDF